MTYDSAHSWLKACRLLLILSSVLTLGLGVAVKVVAKSSVKTSYQNSIVAAETQGIEVNKDALKDKLIGIYNQLDLGAKIMFVLGLVLFFIGFFFYRLAQLITKVGIVANFSVLAVILLGVFRLFNSDIQISSELFHSILIGTTLSLLSFWVTFKTYQAAIVYTALAPIR